MRRARCVAAAGVRSYWGCVNSSSRGGSTYGCAFREIHASTSHCAASAAKQSGLLPNRELVFAILQRRDQQESQVEGRQATKRRKESQTHAAALEPVRRAAEAGDADGVLAALSDVPQHLLGLAAVVAMRLLLQQSVPAGVAGNVLTAGLESGVLSAADASKAATVLLSHFAAGIRGGDKGAAEELIVVATELLQHGRLRPKAAAILLQTAGKFNDGDLLRELWSMLQLDKPTLGECNALLNAAAECGDNEATKLALKAMRDGQGHVNGITLVTLFQAARDRDEVQTFRD